MAIPPPPRPPRPDCRPIPGPTGSPWRNPNEKWPLNAFVCELAAQLESWGILFEVDWVHRGQNQGADAINNDDVSWFRPENWLVAWLGDLPFLVLAALLAPGESSYDSDLSNAASIELGLKRRKTLRVTEPWG